MPIRLRVLLIALGIALVAWLIEYDIMFWRSRWDSFIPDVLVAIITGLIIGLALWRIEVGSERQRQVRRAQGDWNALRKSIAMACDEDYSYTVNQAGTTGYGIETIRGIVGDRPVHVWLEDLGTPDLRAFIDYLAASDELIFAANKLQVALNTASFNFDADRNTINNAAISVALSWIDPNRKARQAPEAIVEEVGELVSNKSVLETAAPYTAAMYLVESKLVDLREALSGGSWSVTQEDFR